MEKQELLNKLAELGIVTTNAFPKKSFLKEGLPVVACYKRELKEDFYFFNAFDSTIYKIPEFNKEELFMLSFDSFTDKYIVPEEFWEKIWKDEPYIELADTPFRDMTLRQYACIHLGIPETGIVWLDELIRKKK